MRMRRDALPPQKKAAAALAVASPLLSTLPSYHTCHRKYKEILAEIFTGAIHAASAISSERRNWLRSSLIRRQVMPSSRAMASSVMPSA